MKELRVLLTLLSLTISSAIPPPPPSQELVSVSASRSGNYIRKLASGSASEMEGMVKLMEQEEENEKQSFLKIVSVQQKEIDRLTKEIDESQRHLTQLLSDVTATEEQVTGIQNLIDFFQKEMNTVKFDRETREQMIQKQDLANQRSSEFEKNTLVFEQWMGDFHDYVTRMLLPGSLVNPGTEALSMIRELRDVMQQGAESEKKSATYLQPLIDWQPSDGGKFDESDSRLRINGLHDQLVVSQRHLSDLKSSIENVLLDTHTAQDRYHELLSHQLLTNRTFEAGFNSIQKHMDIYSTMANSLREFRKNLCPHVCSGNGQCVETECVCDENFEGKDCSRIKGVEELEKPLANAHSDSSNPPNASERFAFDFGRTTHTFIASDEVSCPHNFSQINVAVWVQPRGGGEEGMTLASYASPSRDSEFLLWVDSSCQSLFLWVNSISRSDLMGVPVANFSAYPLCDGRWHHLAISWDGVSGNSRTFIDGRFWENHWNVFLGEQVKSGGRIVLGHNQVHLEPRNRNGWVPDAYLGVLSDFFFIPNLPATPAQILEIFQNSAFSTDIPHIHWSFNESPSQQGTAENKLIDEGSMHVNAMAFGGSWVKAGNRKCGDGDADQGQGQIKTL